MSVMTLDQLRQGRPGQPQMQRQAVIDQLGADQPLPGAANPLPAGNSPEPRATVPSAFQRGGEVRQLPGAGADISNRVAGMGASTGAQVAGRALGNTAAGAAAGTGISMATDYLGGKLKPKEEMPTFGGEFGHITDDYGRRFEGAGPGVAGGAVRGAGYGANPALVAATGGLSVAAGAGIGALIGAMTKNAPSAFSDFRVEDGADAIQKAYKQYLGRDASEQEIQDQLVGQGWDPNDGDRWVGEKGLFSVLGSIRDSEEAKRFASGGATRDAVVEQLGAESGGEPSASMATPGAQRIEGSASGAAPGAAPADPSGWNTDGFAAPKVTAQNFRGQAPPGWDQKKWNDPNHQTPKYVWGRLTQDDNPNDIEQLLAAYPGSSFNGKDKVTIPGVGTIDVYRGASVGLNEPQWLAEGGGGASAGEPRAAAPGSSLSQAEGTGRTALNGGILSDPDTLARIRAELERIMAGQPNRDALLAQMGA